MSFAECSGCMSFAQAILMAVCDMQMFSESFPSSLCFSFEAFNFVIMATSSAFVVRIFCFLAFSVRLITLL